VTAFLKVSMIGALVDQTKRHTVYSHEPPALPELLRMLVEYGAWANARRIRGPSQRNRPAIPSKWTSSSCESIGNGSSGTPR
jgi:hypothetical protein